MADALTDPLARWDPTSQELAYNNFTDRMKVELPSKNDPASSGVITVEFPSPVDQDLVKKSFTYDVNNNIATIKEALIATPSGAACKLQTFSYNADEDITYIVESLGTW